MARRTTRSVSTRTQAPPWAWAGFGALVGMLITLILQAPAAWLAGPALLLAPVPTALVWLASAVAVGRSYRRLISTTT